MRFIPKGFMDAERAIIHVAQATHPERWVFEIMPEKESEVWHGLGIFLNAELLENHLQVLIPAHERRDTIERLYDYEDALMDVREALHAGVLTAEFVDERGFFQFIGREGWATDAGLESLLTGTTWLEGDVDPICRLVLFKKSAIEDFAKLRPAGTLASTEAPDLAALSGQIFAVGSISASEAQDVASIAVAHNNSGKPKIALAKVQRTFDDWRSSQYPTIPTYAQDVAQMKTHGVGRDHVRKLRGSAVTNPSGAPKKK